MDFSMDFATFLARSFATLPLLANPDTIPSRKTTD